ncbi:MAG: hypothetical protein WC007_02795 [Pelobacteraceae bacterium]
MSKKDVIIVGARGLAKELLGYIEEHGGYRVTCILDENKLDDLFGYEVIHPDEYSGACKNAFLAVGYPEHKEFVIEKYRNLQLVWETFVHPTAVISKYVRLGTGSIIAPFVLLAGNAVLSDFVFMNVYSAVGHDSVVGTRCSLMPYSCVNGGVAIGKECLVATGAKILPGVTMGDRCRISAGAIVSIDVPADSLVFGNPAQYQPDVAMLVKARKRELTQESEGRTL